jgi:hypothetical protein
MNNMSWSVRAWPPLLWQAEVAAQLHFDHLDTQVFPVSGSESARSGQTIWRGHLDDGSEAGVAWDWVMLSQDVVAMTDPMCVVTNLRLLGERGEVLTAWESARHLSRIVYGLPWQREVKRAVQRQLND